MGAHDEQRFQRRRQRVLAFICLAAALCAHPLIAHARQSPVVTQAPASGLVALMEKMRRERPASAATLDEARAAGFELLRATRYTEAAEIFAALREASPEDGPSLYGNALALFNLRRIAEAETLARAAVEKSLPAPERTKPANARRENLPGAAADALVLLGVILAVKGDDAGALASVVRAVKIAPDSFDAQLALGRALYGAGDLSAASRAFRAAVALRPRDAQARFFLATALEGAGDDAGALDAYRELARLAPESAEGHLGAGVLLTKRGGEDNAEGIRELTLAVALDGNLYEARVALGRALIREGRLSEAVEHLKRAAELAPQNPEPHYQLAIAYRRLGRKVEADAESVTVRKLHEARRNTGAKSQEPVAPGRQN